MKSDQLGFKIVKPTLLLDKNRVLKNIEKMAGKAKDGRVSEGRGAYAGEDVTSEP